MSIKKADVNTFLNKQEDIFSDFLNNFDFSPVGNELARVKNVRAVIQSIKNLVNTIVGERLYQPKVGCNIYNLNFEFDDTVTDASIVTYVQTTINYYEKRCRLISVTVDSQSDQHLIIITITFSIINNPDPIQINVPIKRIR